MKTEREIYLKPLILREQVAMEQGICSASIYETKGLKAKGHEIGETYDFAGNTSGDLNGSTTTGGEFSVTWD